MMPATLKALKGSIRKWQKIVAGTGVDLGAANCPLCYRFLQRGCAGCPVKRRTGFMGCSGSPWELWQFHRASHPSASTCSECLPLQQAELDFLKSLLPKKPKRKKP